MIAGLRLDRRLFTGPALRMIGAGSVALCVVFAFASAYHRMVPADLEVYLMGARHAFTSNLYVVRTVDQKLPFTYPPFAAFAFLPFAGLSFGAVKGLWALFNVGSVVAGVGFSIRLVRPEMDRSLVWRWACVLSMPFMLLAPSFEAVSLGQVDLMLLWPVLWDLGGFRRTGPRTLPVGVATGITAAIKLVPLIFIPYLFLIRRTRAALTCTATFVACQGVAFALSPSSSWDYWSKEILNTGRFAPIYLTTNQSIYAALGRFAHAQLPNKLGLASCALAGIAGLLLAAWAYWRSSPALGLLVAASASMLASPITWTHHMVWVIPIIIWLAIAPDSPRGGRWFAIGAVVLFWINPVDNVPKTVVMCPCAFLPELQENAGQLLQSNSFFLATAFFMLGVAALLFVRRGRGVPAALAVPHQVDELATVAK